MILLFVLVFGLLGSVLGATCPVTTECSACVRTTGCGFCDSTQACVEGDVQGPASFNCSDGWSFKTCSCSIPKNCRACFKYEDCIWCQALDQNGMCLPSSFVPNATCPLVWNANEYCPGDLGPVVAVVVAIIVGISLTVAVVIFVVMHVRKKRTAEMEALKRGL